VKGQNRALFIGIGSTDERFSAPQNKCAPEIGGIFFRRRPQHFKKLITLEAGCDKSITP
jgi:hypothetical protein